MSAATITPPQELAGMKCWLVWKLVHKPGKKKPLKVPFYVNGNTRGAQNTDEDRAQLVTYAHAMAVLQQGGYDGIGFAVLRGGNVVVLDFDDCVTDGEIARHVEQLCEGTYTEFSPSGNGIHAFFSGSLISRKDVDAKHGDFPVEVFGHTGFVTYTGRVTETCQLFGWEDQLAPLTAPVLEMYSSRGWDAHQEESVGPGLHGLMALQPTLDISLADVAETLQKISPDLPYEEWAKVGMGVHQQTGGTDEGFDIWHRWSQQGAKYSSEKDCRSHWDSYGKYTSGKQLTFAFVAKLAREAEAQAKYAALEQIKAKISACADAPTLRERICADIARDTRIAEMEREDLAHALKARFKALGSVYGVNACKKLIAPLHGGRLSRVDSEIPPWLSGFVYVTDHDKFYRYDSEEWLTHTAFNAKFNRHMPRGESARPIMPAAQCALEDHCIATVTRGMYLPWAGDLTDGTFEMNGVRMVNTYRPSSVPQAADVISDNGQRAINHFVAHIHLLCGGRGEVARHVLQWLAFCVQKPGVKIRHAVLMRGIEGDGKSVIGSAMAMIMGQPNVKQISPKVLGTDFSDWAQGACLAVMEELKLTGHNRYDILNALKPMITNDIIPVHPKGKAEVNVQNTMNYLAFTNHMDALPLTDIDRRWFVVFTPWSDSSDLRAATQNLGYAEPKHYFNELHTGIAEHAAHLRRYFLDTDLEGFDPHAPAPITEEKQAMVGVSGSPEEQLVREVLAAGGEGIGRNIVSATLLVEHAYLLDPSVSLATSRTNQVLSRMNWQKLSSRPRWKGRLHTVWFRGRQPVNPVAALEQASASSTPSSVSVDSPSDTLYGL